MLNKIKSVVLGHAVGDALGVPVECCTREELEANPVTDMIGFGSHPVPAGCWSDDTSMSLCALDSLAKGKVDYNEIMQNFARWATSADFTATGEMFDIGRTCLKAIRRYLNSDSKDAAMSGLDGELYNGNGSLMRIHPFALMAFYNDEIRAEWECVIENASALTHAHERSKLGCKIYTLILFHLLEEASVDSVMKALKAAKVMFAENTEKYHYQRLLTDGFSKLSRDEIKSSGYVVDTLEAAIWCLLTTNDYKTCVLKAVNLGGDTDTVAAVAGGLAGALYGYETIPHKWLETLLRREYIEDMCEGVV